MYSSGDNFLYVFNLNGQIITSVSAGDLLSNIEITRDGDLVITGKN